MFSLYIRIPGSQANQSNFPDGNGLVPKGWEVVSDKPHSIDFPLEGLSFSVTACSDEEPWVGGIALIERSSGFGSSANMNLVEQILDSHSEGREIIPLELRGVKVLIFPDTIIKDEHGHEHFICLEWNKAESKWTPTLVWRAGTFGSKFVIPGYSEVVVVAN
jgi:hypothetical protein